MDVTKPFKFVGLGATDVTKPCKFITLGATDVAKPYKFARFCEVCPQMVVIPAGSFMMGSPEDEAGRFQDEGPQRRVMISSFSAGRNEVTRDEYEACVSAGACAPVKDDGFGGGSRPVTLVSFNDATK